MAVACDGVLKYTIPSCLQAVAAEIILVGESCFIGSDGLAYLVDNGLSTLVHGWAIKTYAAGEMVTLATECRLKVTTTQTIGARVYTGAVSGGSAPSTSLASNGVVCGVAETASIVFVRTPVPAADGA